MRVQLNGWKRWWAVSLVTTLITIGADAWLTLPMLPAEPDALTEPEFSAVRDAWLKKVPPRKIGEVIPEWFIPDPGLSTDPAEWPPEFQVALKAAKEEKLASQMRTLRRQRGRHLFAAGLAWLTLGILTYALGWSVGWVRRGFTGGGQQ